MVIVLDATAGNRMMWKHVDHNPPNVVFMDREIQLIRPPTIFGDYRKCPFRDGVFDCIIFDPPHVAKGEKIYKNTIFANPKHERYMGSNITRSELIGGIYRAQVEFKRLTNRLCFKWSYNPRTWWAVAPLWKILSLFKGWKIININEKKKKTTTTSWVTFINETDFQKLGIETELLDLQYKLEIDKIQSSNQTMRNE